MVVKLDEMKQYLRVDYIYLEYIEDDYANLK